jgi:hypothetical protein
MAVAPPDTANARTHMTSTQARPSTVKFALIAMLAIFFSSGVAQAEPAQVRFGVYVKSIRLNNKDEKAVIDFYYWLRFKKPATQEEIDSLKTIEFVNGEVEQTEAIEERTIGEHHYLTGRVKGRFSFVAKYDPYPFDRQQAVIEIEHKVLPAQKVILVPDEASYRRSNARDGRWGIEDGLRAGEVTVVRSGFETDVRRYMSDFGDPEIEPESQYSRVRYSIYVAREWRPYVLKFFLPLIIIVGLAYLVFFIPPEQLELACSLTVTSILSAIAFQLTIGDDLPNVGYLTCVDKVFYLTYLLIMLAMVQTVWTYHLENDGRKNLADGLELAGRWLFPFAFFGGSLWVMWSALHSP